MLVPFVLRYRRRVAAAIVALFAAAAADAAAADAPPLVCPLCLGCLKQCVRPAAVAAMAEVVRAAKFEAADFNVTCTAARPRPRRSA